MAKITWNGTDIPRDEPGVARDSKGDHTGNIQQGYSYQKPPLTSGLVGWWPLHDDSAQDYSGNDNHGTTNGGVTTGVAGRGGLEAMSFDPSNTEGIDCGVVLGGLPEVTVSTWVKVTGSSANSQYNVAVGKCNSYFLSYQDDTDDFLFRVKLGGTKYDLSAGVSPVLDEEWHLLTGTWDGSTQKVYVDGVEENSQSASGSMDDNTSAHFFISSLDTSTDGNIQAKYVFGGNIFSTRVYNRALSDAEIRRLYEMGSLDLARPPTPDIPEPTITNYSTTVK